ncbi:MAG: hypothetical protein IPG97_17170 [Microthrixaceae bacterium]|nr:hypothetical protein [Microthrixaceae bacterium]
MDHDRTVIDVDDDNLSTRRRRSWAQPQKVATFNRALAEVAARAGRLAFLDHLDDVAGDLADPAADGGCLAVTGLHLELTSRLRAAATQHGGA